MVGIINDFRNIDFEKATMLESSVFDNDNCCVSELIKELYNKGKELSVNLNDEISKIDIPDNQTFSGNIHMISRDIINIKSYNDFIGLSDEYKNTVNNITISSADLKDILFRIPGMILTILNQICECVNSEEKNVCCSDVKNVHEYLMILSRSATELMSLVKANTNVIIETAENVSDYINELNDIINDIRKYYEESDYSKILTPRKKTIDKMEEYVKSALERKYTLRIPLYKIENATKEIRDVIENKFIKDIQSITAKYNNYAVLSPNWDEDEDIYIYLTLKEPFGKKGDLKERKEDSKEDRENKIEDYSVDTNANKKDKDDNSLNESAEDKPAKLSKQDRDALPDSDFGLPTMRKYPLHDEEHIRQAIKMFHYCKPQNKEELAKNIARKVKEKDLVGKVTVSKRNPFKKYFPNWLIEGGDQKNIKKETTKSQNETVVFINDKLI